MDDWLRAVRDFIGKPTLPEWPSGATPREYEKLLKRYGLSNREAKIHVSKTRRKRT